MKTFKKISLLTLTFLLTAFIAVPNLVQAQDAKTITMKGTDKMKFSKTDISAKPGQEVTVKLTTVSNLPKSAMAHNFVLLKAEADASEVAQASAKYSDNDYISPEMKDQIVAYTSMAGGGETVEVTFTAPEDAGEYTYVCTFPGHFLAGMKGTLTVEG